MMNVTDLIGRVASVPSFSSWEERLHPLIREILSPLAGVTITPIERNNLLIEVPGRQSGPPVALTAHMDKIDHFGPERIGDALPFTKLEDRLRGQMDDSAGVGICLSIALQSRDRRFPPLMLLLSEMEESTGLTEHPQRLRNNGEGLHSGIGAERIARFLLERGRIPSMIVTVDTTPHFKGTPGVAIYSRHWERSGFEASAALISATEEVQKRIQAIHPEIKLLNNSNDYVTYGYEFNRSGDFCVPSVALEPSIFPYHQRDEEVFIDDIRRTERIIIDLLEQQTV